MAYNSLNDNGNNQKFLKGLLDLRDKLYDDLMQARALICVASGQDFLEFSKSIQHDYLLTLENLILAAVETYRKLDKCLEND